MSVFAMPSLGADMEAAKLVEWLVRPGDRVAKGDPVAVVETQKGAIEIEIFESGTIADLIAEVGQTLPVGAPLARLDTGDAPAAPVAAPSAPAAPVAEPSTSAAPPPSAAPLPGPAAPLPTAPAPAGSAPADAALASASPASASPAGASPAARARAAELGLALAGMAGTGPGGAVLLADVDRAAARPPPATPTGKPGLDMAEMRRAIAAAMSRSKREIPHYYLTHEIDLQTAQDRLTAVNATRPPEGRLLMGAVLLRATVQALTRVPELNGRHENGQFTPSAPVHCGLAIALRGGGLIAPAILNADALETDGIMAAIRDLVARSRSGRLRNSELTQGTITVSSLGETGVDALTGVIYPPQVALVGFGTPRLKPVVRDGALAARLSVTATLAADHRVSDGRRGALFLSALDHLLQEPALP